MVQEKNLNSENSSETEAVVTETVPENEETAADGRVPVLKPLILGCVLWGILFQAVFMWLASDPLFFTKGLWIGVALAVAAVLHMESELRKYIGFAESSEVETRMRKMYFLRMGCLLIVGLLVVYLKLGHIVAMFLGTFTLKFSAYMQPFLRGGLKRLQKNN